MRRGELPQARGGLFGRQVALDLGQHFVAHQKLFDRRPAQKGRQHPIFLHKQMEESSMNLSYKWLQDYTLGELWKKNILGGRPQPLLGGRPQPLLGERPQQ